MKISILGCGWLGLPLAKKLIEKGYNVKGSTTSENKLEVLQSNKIKPFLIVLSEEKISGNISEFLTDSEVLIIDIPPKLRGDNAENFVQKISNLIPHIEKSVIQKLIFISSTSVYGDSGLIPKITEESIVNPDTESGKQLVQAENLFRKNFHFQTTIIRFGGLIGEDRNPTKFIAGKTNIANPKAPINFIHQEDCIGIISEIVCHTELVEVWNETFNAVAPNHPTRKNYYTQKAIELNLPKPEFNENEPSVGKIVSSEKLEKIINYQFKIQP